MKPTKEQVIKYFSGEEKPSVRKLALLLEVSPQALYQRDHLTEAQCFKIEKLSKGHFKYADLIEMPWRTHFNGHATSPDLEKIPQGRGQLRSAAAKNG